MNYQNFVTSIKDAIYDQIGPGMKVQLHTTLKNNGNERIGISISDRQVNIFPTIYLEEFYEHYQKGISLETIVEDILTLYNEIKMDHSLDIEFLKDYSDVKSKIAHRLVNTARNSTQLEGVPHFYFHDLAIVFYVLYQEEDFGNATIPITNDLMKLWGITIGELYKCAMNNTPHLLPASFKPIHSVVEELLGHTIDAAELPDNMMYVLTNPLRSFGASCILYPGMLEDIACRLGENFYVIPSSVHETIILPESNGPTREHLLEMVKEINETELCLEEILSDNVYYYDFQKRELR